VGVLRESDYRGVLEVLREAAEIDGPVPFPEPVLQLLRQLVPCDVVAYHERVDQTGTMHLGYVGEPRGVVTPEIKAATRRHWDSDPLTVPRTGARKYSDFLSRREWHRLGMYQEAARPLGIEYMMTLWLDPAGVDMARLEFDRGEKDFGERDRAVLDTVRPHLAQFRINACRRRGSAPKEMRLTPREREILELVAEGHQNAEVSQMLWISRATVRKHLENAYEKLGVHTRTAAVAAIRPVPRKRSG
jgi:DNA-binding CsgD family transcriptional regulator